jgi:hypothetical protein
VIVKRRSLVELLELHDREKPKYPKKNMTNATFSNTNFTRTCFGSKAVFLGERTGTNDAQNFKNFVQAFFAKVLCMAAATGLALLTAKNLEVSTLFI